MLYVTMSMVLSGANVSTDSRVTVENVTILMSVRNTHMSVNLIQNAIIMMAVTLVNVKVRDSWTSRAQKFLQAVHKSLVKMDTMIMIVMVIVKILTNAKPEHILARLRKIAIIRYHFINVHVILATLTIRKVTASTSMSVLMVFTTATQMLSVLTVKAVIHVVAILVIVTWLTIVLSQKRLKKAVNVCRPMNVLKILITVTSMPIALIKMEHLAANVKKGTMVTVSHVTILMSVLIICIHAMIMQFVSIHEQLTNVNANRFVSNNAAFLRQITILFEIMLKGIYG